MVSAGQLPKLALGAVTNGQIQLILNVEAGVRHIIESSPDLIHWAPIATNSDNSPTCIVTLAAPADLNFYRASRNPLPLFAYALATQGNLDLYGLGVISDSWNSHDTNQSNNGSYSAYAGTNGNLASVSGIVSISNKSIYGSLYLGTNAYFSGSAGQVSGQVYTGARLAFPDVRLPTTDANGNPIVWLPAPGTSASHSFTQSGYYVVSDNGQIIVLPGITVTLDVNVSSYSPSALTINGGTTNAGTVILYQESGSLLLVGSSGGGAFNNRPENFIYLGMSGVTAIVVHGSYLFVGAIYAPEANATFISGGGPNAVLGSCIANSAIVDAHCIFHFDEGLLTFGPYR